MYHAQRHLPARRHNLVVMLGLRWVWTSGFAGLRRYGVAELVELVVVLGCAMTTNAITANSLLIALSAWGGGAAYYSALLVQEIRSDRHAATTRGAFFGWRGATRTIGNLAVGFSGAELLDSLLVSPALMYLCVEHIANLHLAILLSYLGSAIIFYTIVAVSRYPRRAL
jgi:hypothetical protein